MQYLAPQHASGTTLSTTSMTITYACKLAANFKTASSLCEQGLTCLVNLLPSCRAQVVMPCMLMVSVAVLTEGLKGCFNLSGSALYGLPRQARVT